MRPFRLLIILNLLILLAGCAPERSAPPIDLLATRAVETRGTATPLPTTPPGAQPSPSPPAAEATSPTPALTQPAAYAEPAGCRVPSDAESYAQRLTYAAQLFGGPTPLEKLKLSFAWNGASGTYERASEFAAAFSAADLQPAYRVQDLINALHVAGFAAFLRQDPRQGLNILAVALRPGLQESPWGKYLAVYWQPGGRAAVDATIQPALTLTPCDWMVRQGFAPALKTGQLEGAKWDQPDFVTAGQPFLASNTTEAFQVARQINWLNNTGSESPDYMCGPLAWAILNRAGAFPPGYGGWSNNPISFWLPKPSLNGRPWSLFPSDLYEVTRVGDPIASYDFSQHPLHPGDMIYTYSAGNGFDHILVVTEEDSAGGTYSVTNLVKTHPKRDYSIRRVLLFTPADLNAGIYRNEWSKDLLNGRTGDNGFEVFRWKWRAKDLSGQAEPYTVQPGDSLPLVGRIWRTPPEQIAAANGLDPAQPLKVGQVINIPPNKNN